MRVCHIITSLNLGGAEVLLAHLCNQQAARHSVSVLYLKNIDTAGPLFHPAIDRRHVPLDRRVLGRLAAALDEIRPDIVHTHLSHADWLGQWVARRRRGLFCTIHGTRFEGRLRETVIRAGYRWLFRRVVPQCRILCVSSAAAQHAKLNLGASPAQVSVLPNGLPPLAVPPDRAAARRRLGLAPDEFSVLFVGRLEWQKSVDTLVRAAAEWRSIPQLRVDIVGDGARRREWEALAASLGLGASVRFHGAVIDPADWYAASDLFVLPSHTEAFGIVILEAFRAGLPVVATAIEGPRELVVPGRSGEHFGVGQVAELVAIVAALAHDRRRLDTLRAGALAAFSQRFSIERYGAVLDDHYAAALGPSADHPDSPAPAPPR